MRINGEEYLREADVTFCVRFWLIVGLGIVFVAGALAVWMMT